MNTVRFVKLLSTLFLLWLSSSDARADGGIIRLREIRGPFVITIFTASEPVQGCPDDFSVLVQRRDSSDVMLDANVKLMFIAPTAPVVRPIEQMCGMSSAALLSGTSPTNETQFVVAATRQQASNKLLYAAPVKFNAAGNWKLRAFIERGSDAVNITCDISVESPSPRLIGLFPYLVLPPLMVALFVINQYLRKP